MIADMFEHLAGFRTCYQVWVRSTSGDGEEWSICDWCDTFEYAVNVAATQKLVATKIVKVLAYTPEATE